MEYLYITLIGLCWTLILDIADFRTTLKQIIALGFSIYLKKTVRWEDIRFEACTLCFTFWSGLLYLLLVSNLSLITLTYLLFIACLTPLIRTAIYAIIDCLEYLIIKFDDLWTKQ